MSSPTDCERSLLSNTDPSVAEKQFLYLLVRSLNTLTVCVWNQSEITSSAGLDDDDLWLVHQRRAVSCVQGLKHFVNIK